MKVQKNVQNSEQPKWNTEKVNRAWMIKIGEDLKTDCIRVYWKTQLAFFIVYLNLLGRVFWFLALTDNSAKIKETFIVRRLFGHDAITPQE